MAAKAKASATSNPKVPKGMRVLEGGYAKTWNQDEMPELSGEVREVPKTVTLNKGTRKESDRQCVEVHTAEGRFTLWESAALGALFERLSVAKDLPLKIWVAFKGLGTAKKGQNAPKLFDVAIGE
jgi:hypothetical protein